MIDVRELNNDLALNTDTGTHSDRRKAKQTDYSPVFLISTPQLVYHSEVIHSTHDVTSLSFAFLHTRRHWSTKSIIIGLL